MPDEVLPSFPHVSRRCIGAFVFWLIYTFFTVDSISGGNGLLFGQKKILFDDSSSDELLVRLSHTSSRSREKTPCTVVCLICCIIKRFRYYIICVVSVSGAL